MKKYEVGSGEIWKNTNKQYNPELLSMLLSKDNLITIHYREPPYKVVIGVPHQTGVGNSFICENSEKRRPSDENASSYALVTFDRLKEFDIPCKIVIMCHSTMVDPNKDICSPYCKEIFSEPTELLIECHGANKGRELDITFSSGRNSLFQMRKFIVGFPKIIMCSYYVGVQKRPESKIACVLKEGMMYETTLEHPGLKTTSLTEACNKGIPALQIEAKPQFRIPINNQNEITEDGFVFGQELAYGIKEYLKRRIYEYNSRDYY